MEPSDFARALADDPSAALDDLMSRDYSERTFDQPDWRDALSLITGVAESHPDLGDHLWTLISERIDLTAQGRRPPRAGHHRQGGRRPSLGLLPILPSCGWRRMWRSRSLRARLADSC